MLRSILALCSAIAFSIGTAAAETPLERGSYLVNSIMACGNCHTPKCSRRANPRQGVGGRIVFQPAAVHRNGV